MADDEEDIPVITRIKIDATLKRLEREVQEIADVVVTPLTPSQPYPQSTRLVASQSLIMLAAAAALNPSLPNGQSSPECQTQPVS